MGTAEKIAECQWVSKALAHFADAKIESHEEESAFSLRGQYAENRIFLRRILRDYETGAISPPEMKSLEQTFNEAIARPENDIMLGLEKAYLDIFDKRQQSNRRVASATGLTQPAF